MINPHFHWQCKHKEIDNSFKYRKYAYLAGMADSTFDSFAKSGNELIVVILVFYVFPLEMVCDDHSQAQNHPFISRQNCTV